MLNWLPPDISTFGPAIDRVMSTIYWVVGVWFVIAEALLFYLFFRFKHRDGVRARWAPGTGKAAAWILIPAALVLGCDLFLEASQAQVWSEVKEQIPPARDLVKITGSQFAWSFSYPSISGKPGTQEIRTVGDLYVPQGQVVRFELASTDVIHSFFVPNLRLKQDVIPGRLIPGWFEATKTGDYPIMCTELCGVGHTMMKGMVHVLSPEAYQAWLSKQTAAQAPGNDG